MKAFRIIAAALISIHCLFCFVGDSHAQENASASLTFTNPTPEIEDHFGRAVAALGTDRVLIGAERDRTGTLYAGAAYLYTASGMLLTTFTNPTPELDERFGVAVAAVGGDKVLIGAFLDNTGSQFAGAAYLFNTNGALLITFTNPTPAFNEAFAFAVAASGEEKVIIGAFSGDHHGTNQPGVAYLFDTTGTVLAAFTNPTPADLDYFGYSVAAVDSDKVLIGAPWDDRGATNAGVAYLFSTNGTLLITLTNPNPENFENFGVSVAAVGTDRILIGAHEDQSGGTRPGAAYLFSTNGTLLTTLTNPTPADFDFFGFAVASIGSDKLLIGAFGDDFGVMNSGAAYLFSTNGALLTTFTNPTAPSSGDSDWFGSALTPVGENRVLIGAYRDSTGAAETGAAHLFDLRPSLTIRSATNAVIVSWSSVWGEWTIQQTTNLTGSNWTPPVESVIDNGSIKSIFVNPPLRNRFYRLFKP